MSGLPGAGKDRWIHEHYRTWPVVSLDDIRHDLKVAPADAQGVVVQAAKARARELLRQKQSFVWNATNVTRTLRSLLVDLFADYGAYVRIIYIDASLDEVLRRNRERRAGVPEQIVRKLLAKLDVPDLTEAHAVQWVYDGGTTA